MPQIDTNLQEKKRCTFFSIKPPWLFLQVCLSLGIVFSGRYHKKGAVCFKWSVLNFKRKSLYLNSMLLNLFLSNGDFEGWNYYNEDPRIQFLESQRVIFGCLFFDFQGKANFTLIVRLKCRLLDFFHIWK